MFNYPERRSVRRGAGASFGTVDLTVEALAPHFYATVQDISVQGIGLVVNRPVETGAKVTIRWQDSSRRPLSPLPAQVRAVTGLSDGTWLLGCAFSRLLTVDDVLGLR